VRLEGRTARLRVEVIARDQNVAWVEFSLVNEHGQEAPVQWPRVAAFAVPFRLRPQVGDPSDPSPVDDSLGGVREVKVAKQKVKEMCDASPADAGYTARTCRTPVAKPFYLTGGLISDTRTTGTGRSARTSSMELLDFGRGKLNAAGRLLAPAHRFIPGVHTVYGRLTRVDTSDVPPPGRKRRGFDAGVPDEHFGLAIIHVEAMRGQVVRWQELGLLQSQDEAGKAVEPPVQVEGQRFFPDGERRGEERFDVRGLGELLVTGSYVTAWESFTRKSPPIRGNIELTHGRSSLREVARSGDNQSKALISVAADPLSDGLADLPFTDRYGALASKETSFSEEEPRKRTVTSWKLVDLPLMR
jgi:hypothetical protein